MLPDTCLHRDQAIEILSNTHDGNDLSPSDLSLLETVVNHGLVALSPFGRQYWEQLHAKAIGGTYLRPWLHMQQHLTKDLEGYVYWRGVQVEHFSFRNADDEARAAQELARVCQTVEARALPMCWASCAQIYDEARYGQGLQTPRFHVLWTMTEKTDNLTLIPEKSLDQREAHLAADQFATQFQQLWKCSDGALRRYLVTSQDTLDECRKSIRGDVTWAKAVLRISAERCNFVEQKLDTLLHRILGDTPLASQRTLSEHVLTPDSSTLRSGILDQDIAYLKP